MTTQDAEVMTPHKKAACQQLTPLGQRLFKYVEFDEDETILAEVHKHPIGLAFIWLTGGFITAAIVLSVLMVTNTSLLTNLGVSSSTSFNVLALFICLITSVLVFIATAVSAFIYKSSTIFVTSDKTAEVVYKSLFNRQVRQLGIGNVEDVTVIQKGILPRLFHFGDIIVETAGENQSPDFTTIPNPNVTSQIIIKAHEAYVEKFGN